MYTDSSPEHEKKVPWLISVSDSGSLTVTKAGQLLNAYGSIRLTESGMSMDIRFSQ